MAENDKIQNGARKVEEMKRGLTQLTKLCKAFQEKGDQHSKTTGQLGDALLAFQQPKEGELKDAGFILAMQKFADIFVDISILEGYYGTECINFITNVSGLVQEINENWKRLYKAYDKARTAYDKQRSAVAQEKEKKLVVAKLYQAEKERAKLYAEYMKAMHALEVYCDEVDDKLSFTFVEFLTKWFAAQRNMLGLSYAELDEVKFYLLELQAWCREEDRVCEEQRVEREKERKKLHAQQTETFKKNFVHFFNNWEFINAILESSIDLETNSQTRTNLCGAFVVLLPQYDLAVPNEIASCLASSGGDPFTLVAAYCKENFDAIGSKLLEKGQTPLLLAFGDALAALEKLPA